MTKTILILAIVAAFGAGYVGTMSVVSADHIYVPTATHKTGLVGDSLEYILFPVHSSSKDITSFDVSCQSPATATISPNPISQTFGFPAVVSVTSNTEGTFDCTVAVEYCVGTKTSLDCSPNQEVVVTSTFVNLAMCGPGTILNSENKCVPNLSNVCGEGTIPNENNDQCIPEPIPNEPPVCTQAVANPNTLWPPNHEMHNISIEAVTDPEGDPISVTVTSITQDEPTNGLGDGDVSPDGTGLGTSTASVRAESSGLEDGRVYQINFEADDGSGGVCTGTVTVGVPHDKKGTPQNSGQSYDSTLS